MPETAAGVHGVPRIEVDLDAIRANVAALRERIGARLLVVVKADAYGHGAVPVAKAAVEAGAERLGVVELREALELREAGIEVPIVAWLHGPGTRWRRAFEAGVELGVSSLEQLTLVGDAAAAHIAAGGSAPDLHIKVDTGLGRGGAPRADWPALFGAAAELEAAGTARVLGLLSHFSGTSERDDRDQADAFERARELAARAGLRVETHHLGASAAALAQAAPGDMVRIGIAAYGLSPFGPARDAGVPLRPALRLLAPLVLIEDRGGRERVAVELGTGDGLPPLPPDASLVLRDAAGGGWRAEEQWETHTLLAPADAAALASLDELRRGTERELTLIGTGDGHAGADAWASAAQTINYEVVARLSPRIQRIHLGERARQRPPRHAAPITEASRPGAREHAAQLQAAPPQAAAIDESALAWGIDPARVLRGDAPGQQEPGQGTHPARTAIVRIDRFRQRLAERAAEPALDEELPEAQRGTVDLSADAYGHGAARLLPLVVAAGLRPIVRRRADAAALAALGAGEVPVIADPHPATRETYLRPPGVPGYAPLLPVMRLESELVLVKRVAAGQGVSYGYLWRADRATELGLVPFGYADGLPRRASGEASVRVIESAHPVVGRVAMDQCVVELRDTDAWVGDAVLLFGEEGPTLAEWASAAGLSPLAATASLGVRVDVRWEES